MKNSIKYFSRYLKKYRVSLTVVMVTGFLSALLIVKMPDFIGQGINEMGTYVMTLATTGNASLDPFLKVVMVLALLAGFNWVLSVIQNTVMTIVSGKATDDMRNDLFRKLEALPIRFFDQTSDGEILARFTSDLDNISNALNQSIHQLIINTFMLTVSLILMFRSDFWFSIVTLSTSPIVLFVGYTIIKRSQKYIRLQQKEIGRMNGFADERFAGQKVIITNGLQGQMIDEFKEYNESLYQATFKGQLYSNLLFPVLMGLQMLTTGIVIFYGAYMTLNGHLAIEVAAGTIFLFTQYARMIYQPLSQIASQYTQMQMAMTGADRIMEVLVVEPETDRDDVVDIDGIHGDVELDHVTFSYDGKHDVLKDININVQKGQMVALVGHTGSGKTTIMNLLNRFYDVEQGVIRFDGRDIRDISLPSLREHVGIVLQDSVLFGGTIHYNIAFGKPDATREAVIEVAKRTHMHDYIMSLDDGYDTIVSESNPLMSVGQKQLISIARTMLVDPDLLILDEATSNVDTVTENLIQKAMDEVTVGRTSFVIAHRLKTILDAHHIIVLQQGQIVEEGNHDTLLQHGGIYAELYKNQFVFEA